MLLFLGLEMLPVFSSADGARGTGRAPGGALGGHLGLGLLDSHPQLLCGGLDFLEDLARACACRVVPVLEEFYTLHPQTLPQILHLGQFVHLDIQVSIHGRCVCLYEGMEMGYKRGRFERLRSKKDIKRKGAESYTEIISVL